MRFLASRAILATHVRVDRKWFSLRDHYREGERVFVPDAVWAVIEKPTLDIRGDERGPHGYERPSGEDTRYLVILRLLPSNNP